MTEKSIGIVTFEDFQRRANVGSSRIRARWLLNYWPEAEAFVTGRKYGVVIFQKAYWLQYAEVYDGIKIVDVCEPDFLNWRREMRRMMQCCHAVTAATEELVEVLKGYTDRPVYCIPDRLDPRSFSGLRKDHAGRGRARTVAWYGYSHNFAALDSIVADLPDLGVEEVVVVADAGKPYRLPPALGDRLALRNFNWGPETVYGDLLRADVVLNPRIARGRWKYKSNNKTLAAWAIGLPVAHTKEELIAFIPEAARIKEAEMRHGRLYDEYHVSRSVDEFRRLIRELEGETRARQSPSAERRAQAVPESHGSNVS